MWCAAIVVFMGSYMFIAEHANVSCFVCICHSGLEGDKFWAVSCSRHRSESWCLFVVRNRAKTIVHNTLLILMWE